MATSLKNIRLTSVDLVRAGANQEADIVLHKSADGGRSPDVQDKLREYNEALYRSFRSYQDDDGLTSEEKKNLLNQSLAQYREAVAELFNPEEEPEEDLDLAADGEDRFDTIEEVRKFNPFHDALGRFASKNGFKTYSANPKMRAAQPSIIRSAIYGHGHTLNVHRESKGENINQNYDWMTGKPYGKPVAPPAPTKPPTSKPATPKPSTTQTASSKPTTHTDEHGHTVAEGADLTKGDPQKIAKTSIDDILEQQGFNGKPRVVTDIHEFTAAVQTNGNVMVRSLHAKDDRTLDQYEDQLKNGSFYVQCKGGNAMGRGMYAAASWNGTADYNSALYASQVYGPRSINMTLDKSAKIISESALSKMIAKEPPNSPFRQAGSWSNNDTAAFDMGAYAAAKGYDAIRSAGDKGSYTVVLNRTKLVMLDQTGDLRDMPGGDVFDTPLF